MMQPTCRFTVLYERLPGMFLSLSRLHNKSFIYTTEHRNVCHILRQSLYFTNISSHITQAADSPTIKYHLMLAFSPLARNTCHTAPRSFKLNVQI